MGLPDGARQVVELHDYILVSDLAEAHRIALDHLRSDGESLTLNCGYGRAHSVVEVIEVVKRISGRDFTVCLCPRRSGAPARMVAEASFIRERLGWRPRHDGSRGHVVLALA